LKDTIKTKLKVKKWRGTFFSLFILMRGLLHYYFLNAS
jgi:hypothetical protein